MYLVGIDAGTSSIKAAVFDLNGQEIASSRKKIDTLTPMPGRMEQDMEMIENAARETIREVIQASGTAPEDTLAVGITGQSAGTFLIDAEFRPIKAILWRDSRADQIVETFRKTEAAHEYYDLCGWPISSQYSPVQLAWLKSNEPKVVKHSRWCLSCADWIALLLTSNVRGTSTAMIGCINARTRRYEKRLFELLRIEDCMRLYPDLIDPWEVVGEVTGEASKKTGLGRGTPVISAGYDQTCSALGTGTIQKGQAATVLGTGGAHIVATERPLFDKRRLIASQPHAVPNRWVAVSEALSATPNLEWFADTFLTEDEKQCTKESEDLFKFCEKKISEIPAGARGVIYHPFLYGETAPFMNPNARGMFFGINSTHSRHDLLRAVYEGVGYSMRDNYDALRDLVMPEDIEVTRVRLAGGGSKSQIWCQIIADINNLEMEITNGLELGCKGAAICAAVASKTFDTFEEAIRNLVRTVRIYRPDRERYRKYRALFEVYVGVYKAVSPYWDKLITATIN